MLAADPGRYDYAPADGLDVMPVDTGDLEAVGSACRALDCCGGLAGIASSSDYFVEAAAEVARTMGLPGERPEGIRSCRNKAEQRRRLAAAGLAAPGSAVARSTDQLDRAVSLLGCALVLKPLVGSGSVGVRFCADEAAVVAHGRRLLAADRNERGDPVPAGVLLERFVEGVP